MYVAVLITFQIIYLNNKYVCHLQVLLDYADQTLEVSYYQKTTDIHRDQTSSKRLISKTPTC